MAYAVSQKLSGTVLSFRFPSLVYRLASPLQLHLFLGNLAITLLVSLPLHVLIEKPYVLLKCGCPKSPVTNR